MKKQRIYLDTSVFGGYFDSEFKEFTVPLFKRIFADTLTQRYNELWKLK